MRDDTHLIITIASGKGGTGKTTVAVNLALALGTVNLLDCDVEEPNAHTLLRTENETEHLVTVPIPVIDQDKCTLCGKCGEFCAFNALFVGKSVMVYEKMCHSCGGCALVCPEGAITEEERKVGVVHEADSDDVRLVYGKLDVGEPIAISMIKAVKSRVERDKINILDAPPGTACPVIETMQDADFLLLVTEPTPFGIHDLSMAVEVARTVGVPLGIVINRAGLGNYPAREHCERLGVPVLMEIPFDRKIAELYARGEPFVKEMPEWRDRFLKLYRDIKEGL